jgi:hypothetical protein
MRFCDVDVTISLESISKLRPSNLSVSKDSGARKRAVAPDASQPMAGARLAKMSTTKLHINARAPMTGLERADSKPLHPLTVC